MGTIIKKDKEKEMCQISDRILEKLQKDVEEIKVALLGNEYNPAGGLLCRTNELEKELEKLKDRYNKIMWMAGGAGAIIAILFNILKEILI